MECSSVSDDGTFAPRIGATAELAGGGVDPGSDDPGRHPIGRAKTQDVTATAQLLEHLRGERPFDLEHPRLCAVVVERTLRVQRVHPRCFDGRLDVETKV